jgi:hypothetical protein
MGTRAYSTLKDNDILCLQSQHDMIGPRNGPQGSFINLFNMLALHYAGGAQAKLD